MKTQPRIQITMKAIPRLFGALCASLFCIHQVQAADVSTNQSAVQLTIELRDGSRVVGKSAEATLAIPLRRAGRSEIRMAGHPLH